MNRASSRVEAGTSGFLSISDIHFGVSAELDQGSQASSFVEAWNSACLLHCPWGIRPFVYLIRKLRLFSEDEPGVTVPLRVVTSSSGLHSKKFLVIGTHLEWRGKLVSFGMWHDPQGFLTSFNLRQASS